MKLPTNPFASSMDGETRYGCWAGLATGYATEILATTGFDWLLIDGEHAPNTVQSILAQLQAVAPYPCAPVVRCVDQNPALIKRLLDIGTQTLMIPMVDNAEQAAKVVAATRYPPQGIRGVGGGLTRATRWNSIDDYMDHAHESLYLIVQIESRAGVENAEAIAATQGVDAIFVGPMDLSTDAGHVGQPNHPDIQAMIRGVLQAGKSAGKHVGILAPAEADARRYAEWGFDFIAVAIDISLLRQAATQTLARYRSDVKSPDVGHGY